MQEFSAPTASGISRTVYVRPKRAIMVVRTHDDQSLLLVGWPRSEFAREQA